MLELIKNLCSIDGVSGNEDAVREYIIKLIDGHCEYSVDNLGNIIAFKKGKKRPAKKIMLDAHMDEVGLIATYITDDGLIKFDTIGYIKSESLLSQRVRFGNVLGVIGNKPIHLTSADERKKLPKATDLYIDIGCDKKEDTEKLLRVGDTAVFSTPFCEKDGRITARALDDRIGCAVLIKLILSEPLYDFYATFTVSEEIGTVGAMCATYTVEPDCAICLEATTASDILGVSGGERVSIVGEGPAVSFMDKGTLYDRELFDMAMDSKLKCQKKTAVAGGNNSRSIQRSRGGVKTMAISVPCRYIHS
ncbi:MAG: M42 family peptidase, partial [Clostridia bacterium]|nr:M42 family peptidase [Clostridia bacterium]